MDTQSMPDPARETDGQAGRAAGAAAGTPVEPAAVGVPSPTTQPRKHGRLKCILVGALISFVGGSLLYGPANVAQGLLFATICTAGIGLLLILAVCWMIGWVALQVWDSVNQGRKVTGTP